MLNDFREHLPCLPKYRKLISLDFVRQQMTNLSTGKPSSFASLRFFRFSRIFPFPSFLPFVLAVLHCHVYIRTLLHPPHTRCSRHRHSHVIIPKALVKWLPSGRLAEEDEWRGLGIRQSPGWETYILHAPEPHILLFKRDKNYGQ